MGKAKAPGKSGGDPEEDPNKEVKVNTYPAERDLINKVAGARGQKVADFFASEDVRDLLMHLFADALEKEKESQAKKKT